MTKTSRILVSIDKPILHYHLTLNPSKEKMHSIYKIGEIFCNDFIITDSIFCNDTFLFYPEKALISMHFSLLGVGIITSMSHISYN